MYHLFNSTYVQSDAFMEPAHNQINISKRTGLVKTPGITHTILGQQLAYSEGLEKLTTAEFKAIMELALGFNDKLYFYVDSKTYVELYGILLKALFPNIDFQTFKFFFICKKASYDVMNLNFFNSLGGIGENIIIDEAAVLAAWELDNGFSAALRELLIENNEALSLEWRIVKMLATGDVNTVPGSLVNIVKRSVICFAQDAAAEWGRLVTDDAIWPVAGCTEATLLSADTTLGACANFKMLGSPAIHSSRALSLVAPDAWLIDLLTQTVAILDALNETTLRTRAAALLQLIRPESTFQSVDSCVAALKIIFLHTSTRVGVPREDSAKYDVNLISHLLKQSVPTLQTLAGDAPW